MIIAKMRNNFFYHLYIVFVIRFTTLNDQFIYYINFYNNMNNVRDYINVQDVKN